MIALARAFDERILAPAPATRLAALRVLVGAYGTVFLAVRTPYLLDVSALPPSRFEPVGVLAWLGEPVAVAAVRIAIVAGLALGVAFTVGWRYRFAAPLYAVALLALTTYENSWQQVLHTENLMVLHTIVLAVAPAAAAWSFDARRHGGDAPRDAPEYGWPVRVMSVVTVLTYGLAGWAKVRHGGADWVAGDVLRNLVAHDNLRKIVLGDLHSPIGAALVAHGWLFPPLALASIAVELGAPIALLRGRPRLAWIVGAWVFHLFVLAVMAIAFVYPLSGVAFASMLRPDLAWQRLRARRSVVRRAGADA